MTLDASGNTIAEMRYYPFGETRVITGTMPTDRLYTGQRLIDGLGGLYHYNARFYLPKLGRFISADTIVPGVDSQAYNRYAYVRNNPLRYTDPTGHFCLPCLLAPIVAVGIWLAAPVPVYGPENDSNFIALQTQAESDPQVRVGRWIDEHPVEYVILVTFGVEVLIHVLAELQPREQHELIAPATPSQPDPAQVHDPNQFHYDLENGGPAQLEQQYPQTRFRFTSRGAKGPDVEWFGGIHPSDQSVYPGSTWQPGNDYGDFKPNTSSGWSRFWREIQNGKLPPNTQPLPYDDNIFELLRERIFGPR